MVSNSAYQDKYYNRKLISTPLVSRSQTHTHNVHSLCCYAQDIRNKAEDNTGEWSQLKYKVSLLADSLIIVQFIFSLQEQ